MKETLAKAKHYSKWLWLLLFSYFGYLMLEITLRYIPFHTDTAFLQIKQQEVTAITSYITFFYIHVYSALFVLLAGYTQFSSSLLERFPKLHRISGKVYAFIVLLLAAPSGIFIGYYANGGLSSQIAFILLGLLWFFFTLKGIIAIRKKAIIAHRNFMLRSFALALSAITLRLWKVILVYLFHPNPMDVYQIIAWLGWIPNLILAEWLIRSKKQIK
ncbi:DUF2306 domain-containing protein [Flavobacterium cerinum]|uniref:DUF2306 domain-containing protein n=1 Tax=Flavobacterium cerinum TaxID=2502784 RepID=A0ABY5IUT9_9FLAO|nr:DUF2306 domain-containing protein [Flavobacterium cerinum]UUC45302.1 DUF2306 domain-containing protein [Flavobacterium cerinum]